jgi:lipoate-protein ligase A
MLWQNHNAIIVGKHQNTQEEINAAFVKEKNISVVRRLSGGGAVYHDLGNLNFTFISAADKTKGIDFSVFCEPIREALRSFGVPVELSGRNDMTVEGKKFSGNAQYLREGRVMHHGTILYDSDLSVLSRALNPGNDKIESRGIKSLRSRVANIRPYMKSDMPASDFWAALRDYMSAAFDMREFALGPEHDVAVEKLREEVYSQWSWNYGNSPPCTLRRTRRFEGCGKIEILLDIEQGGIIRNAAFYGDFFGNREPDELGAMLSGHHLEYDELKAVLASVDISRYFHALENETFLALLLGNAHSISE